MSWALGAVVVVLAVAMAFIARRMVTARTELAAGASRDPPGRCRGGDGPYRGGSGVRRPGPNSGPGGGEPRSGPRPSRRARPLSACSPPTPPSEARNRLAALWGLTLFELARAWPLDSPDGVVERDSATGSNLAAALSNEVERIREETGTPGTLRSDLDPAPAAPVSEAVWRTSKALLGVLVRHTQAFDVVLSRQAPDLVATVVCEGWEGPESVADDISELYAVVAPSGIHLEVDQDAEGRVRATLRVPESN